MRNANVIFAAFLAIIAVALTFIVGTLYDHGDRISKLEAKMEYLGNSSDEGHKAPTTTSLTEVDPNGLIDLVKEQQSKYVRESWGTYEGQCFTENDLNDFINNKTTDQIKHDLKSDADLIGIVLAIKRMPPGEWSKLKSTALNTYKPTWAQLGRISKEGQTDAGQQAEKMIAAAIVSLVSELLNKSEEDLNKLYEH